MDLRLGKFLARVVKILFDSSLVELRFGADCDIRLPMSRALDLADQSTFSAVPGIGSLTARSTLHALVERLQGASQSTDSLDGAWNIDAEVSEDHLYGVLREDALTDRQRLGVLFSLYVLRRFTRNGRAAR